MRTKPVKMKFCKLCERDFPWTPTYFHYWNKASGRLHHYCKSCKISYVMAWKHGDEFKKIERRKKAAKLKNTVFIKKQTLNKKRSIKPKKLTVKKPIRQKKITTIVVEVKTISPKKILQKVATKPDLRKDCRKAVDLFLSNRISTTDLIKAIQPFYGYRTREVVRRLRFQMGL